MTILDEIAGHKQQEVQQKKNETSVRKLEGFPSFKKDGYSLVRSLEKSSSGIITEFKRKSPSKANINLEAKVEKVVVGYEKAGAAGISVLTDEFYFGGSQEDLLRARELVNLPILRKEFIVDEYQIIEAKALGADIILLIAAILNKKQIKTFTQTAKNLGLEVLLEVHNAQELQESLLPELDIIGVNNRNLKTFTVDLNTSKELAAEIPPDFLKISESGISSVDAINNLRNYGFQGFLMGENFMKTQNPANSAADFIAQLK